MLAKNDGTPPSRITKRYVTRTHTTEQITMSESFATKGTHKCKTAASSEAKIDDHQIHRPTDRSKHIHAEQYCPPAPPLIVHDQYFTSSIDEEN